VSQVDDFPIKPVEHPITEPATPPLPVSFPPAVVVKDTELRPGDRVVYCLRHAAPLDLLDTLRAELSRALPGVEIFLVAGVESVQVYRNSSGATVTDES